MPVFIERQAPGDGPPERRDPEQKQDHEYYDQPDKRRKRRDRRFVTTVSRRMKTVPTLPGHMAILVRPVR